MKKSLAALYALLLTTLGGAQAIPAAMAAAIYHYSAETTASTRRQGTVSASGIDWNCQGSRCTTSGPWATPGVGACNALAQQVGPVRSYGHKGGMLTPGELRQCNAGVATGQPKPFARGSQPVTPPSATPPAAPVPGVGLLPMQPPPRLNNAPVAGFATPQAPAPLMADPAKKSPVTIEVNRKASPYPENWTEPDTRADKSHVFEDMRNELRKNDQPALPSAKEPSTSFQLPSKSGGRFIPQVAMSPTTPNPAKKPSGAKGSTPAPQPPPPAETKAPTALGSPGYPVRIRTEGLSVTGAGGTEVRLPVTSIRIRTEGLSVTGTGGTEVRLPVTSKRIRTERLTVTGAGSDR